MSLISILKKKNKIDCFTTPSHSQNFFIFSKLRQFYKYDISETDAYNPQEALLLAQKKASEIYKTKSTHFLTNGSTSGVIAAVLACVQVKSEKEKVKSDVGCENYSHSKILIWDNAHICHKNAVTLAGAEPVFYSVEKDEDWGIYKSVDPESIESKLKAEAISAVIITSPTYEGVVSDIKTISEICKKYGTYLIVDEAHGALYPFCEKLPTSAIYSGADFVVQSLHKTAGGLNPTALLHCNRDDMDVYVALETISTTSPSYPLLASIEKNINYLNSTKGRKYILDLIENIEDMKKRLPNWEFYEGDPTKILVKISSSLNVVARQKASNLQGIVTEAISLKSEQNEVKLEACLTGFELSKILFNKYKIEDEITNETSTMFLCGIGTDLKKLKKLERALKSIQG